VVDNVYKVLIVDDEPWALVAIRKGFNWEVNGFSVIGETTSGKNAIDIIAREQPDVVFTDIRMPGIDGIELIQTIRGKNIDTEFIIMSSYGEFSYAQQALKYKVLEYCLKPIDPTKSNELLKRIHNHLEAKESIRGRVMMDALMSNAHDTNGLLHSYMKSHKENFWCVMVIYFLKDNHNDGKLQFIKPLDELRLKVGANKYLYIINLKSQDDLINIKTICFSDFGIKSIGVSNLEECFEDSAKLIKQADVAALNYFVNEENKVFFYSKNTNKVQAVINEIFNAILKKNYSEVQKLIEESCNLFVVEELGMPEAIYFWNQVTTIITNTLLDSKYFMDLEIINYLELEGKFKNFEQLCKYLIDAFTQLKLKNSAISNDSNTNIYFARLVKYIDENYNRDLYLKELADKFYINQFYCSDLFKKIIGKTFSEYIATLRIEKACELMNNLELSVEKIAELVGYNDYYYFNKVFKKYTDITPAKYRKNCLNENK
jgi:two-component system, response regulator YesN